MFQAIVGAVLGAAAGAYASWYFVDAQRRELEQELAIIRASCEKLARDAGPFVRDYGRDPVAMEFEHSAIDTVNVCRTGNPS